MRVTTNLAHVPQGGDTGLKERCCSPATSRQQIHTIGIIPSPLMAFAVPFLPDRLNFAASPCWRHGFCCDASCTQNAIWR